MTTKTLVHQESLPATAGEGFKLLITPSAICSWWSAASAIVQPQLNGIWAATWGEDTDAPHYVSSAVMTVFEPDQRIVLTDYSYWAKEGDLPFDADFTTEFLINPLDNESSRLTVSQDGFPDTPEAQAFYDSCVQGWQDTFLGILRYLDQSGL